MTKPIPAIPLVATGAPQGAAAATSSAKFPLPGWPLFRLGFRPFYLGAAAFALFAVPYWIAGLLGVVALPATMPPLLWHAHEMLYGFAVAVIVGFLLTAGKAWTGLATPRGATLAVMAGLWLAARLSAVGAPYAVYAALDVVLLPWVASLELHGWRLAGLARSEAFALGRAASRQALQALHAARHTRIQPHRWLNQPWLARLLMATAPAVMPLPLEDYLRFHFSKVGAQTRQMLDSYIQMGVQTGQPVDQLQQLLQRLQALDQPPGSFRVCSLRSGCRSAP